MLTLTNWMWFSMVRVITVRLVNPLQILTTVMTRIVVDRSTDQAKQLIVLSVRISSYGCTREVWRVRKKRKSCSRRKPRATLASWVFCKVPKCIHNSIYAQLKAWSNSFITWVSCMATTNWALKHVLFLIDYNKFSRCPVKENKSLNYPHAHATIS